MADSGASSFANIDRRTLLARMAQAGLVVAGAPLTMASLAHAQFKAFPFPLGVASGEPSPDGFVIWTRIAPEPLHPRGGLPNAPLDVQWEIATGESMKVILRAGKAVARPELAHSVHVEIDGLQPGRDYFYRFRIGGIESARGRARTLPAAGAPVERLRFVSAGCQQWERGFFTAWRAIADEHPDFVFHYGDYIYENKHFSRINDIAVPRTLPDDFVTCHSLADYRRRYAFYKTDKDLQVAHETCCFLPSFDDHEVSNNWAGDTDPHDPPREKFLLRRAAAFQAWYEHMPLRRRTLPRGPDVLAYRDFAFGNLAHLAVLDTRQYRSKQPCDDGVKSDCAQADEQNRTMMGAAQEKWLTERLKATRPTWQIFAQQVLFSQIDWRAARRDRKPNAHNMDKWDGATAARKRLIAAWRQTGAQNPVVLSGDLHKAIACDIKENWQGDENSIGVEFLATSISSEGDGRARLSYEAGLFRDNPHLKYISDDRGYTRHDVTARQWRADYRAVEKVSVPNAAVKTRKSYVVERGRPSLNEA